MEEGPQAVVAHFLAGELDSERFGPAMLAALAADGRPATVVRSPDLRSPVATRLTKDGSTSSRRATRA